MQSKLNHGGGTAAELAAVLMPVYQPTKWTRNLLKAARLRVRSNSGVSSIYYQTKRNVVQVLRAYACFDTSTILLCSCFTYLSSSVRKGVNEQSDERLRPISLLENKKHEKGVREKRVFREKKLNKLVVYKEMMQLLALFLLSSISLNFLFQLSISIWFLCFNFFILTFSSYFHLFSLFVSFVFAFPLLFLPFCHLPILSLSLNHRDKVKRTLMSD